MPSSPKVPCRTGKTTSTSMRGCRRRLRGASFELGVDGTRPAWPGSGNIVAARSPRRSPEVSACSGSPADQPAPAAGDADGHHLVAGLLERGHDRPGRLQRDLVLARAAAEKHARHRGGAPASPSASNAEYGRIRRTCPRSVFSCGAPDQTVTSGRPRGACVPRGEQFAKVVRRGPHLWGAYDGRSVAPFAISF